MRVRTLTVSQLNEYVKGVFEDELVLHDLNVEGEVYEYRQTPSATFITLKDGDCLLHCVSFESTEKAETGDKVSLHGNVSFYERSGKVSFVFGSLHKIGAGNLLKEFNELKNKLLCEGLFDRKKSVPVPIKSVAIITAETGAVIHDFVKTVTRTRNFTDIHIYSSAVQGKCAPAEIISNIAAADKSKCDVIVLARGGGSSDDLSVFNDESVVRAVANSVKPIISAIGHETDFTLCDFAASVRAGTPSMAGEYISRLNDGFFERFYNAVNLLSYNADKLMLRKTNTMYSAASALSYKCELRLQQIESRIIGMSDKISYGAESVCAYTQKRVIDSAKALYDNFEYLSAGKTERLERAVANLDTNNPLRILSMGYSKLYTEDGSSVTIDNVKTGDTVSAVISGGKLTAKVISKSERGK